MSSDSGQTAIEYIMLLGVVFLMVLGVFRSPLFKRTFVDPGEFFVNYTLMLGHAYRNGFPGRLPIPQGGGNQIYNEDHPSYYSGSETRFFTTIEKYPSE